VQFPALIAASDAEVKSPSDDSNHRPAICHLSMRHDKQSAVTPDAAPGWRSYPPFYAYVGATLERLENGDAVLRLVPRPELANTKGDLHGGIIASLIDMALSQAVRSGYDSSCNTATVALNINYLATARGEVRAHAKLVRAGTTIAYAEAEVTGANGAVIARATATYRIIRRWAERTPKKDTG
jgi:uncharacterized protein (TIGR00369 family)